MTFIVGLTGGIGAGKSTVAQFFASYGTPIIDTDLIARELVAPQLPAFTKIIEHFGSKFLLNGELNRAALREIVFNNETERKWLENLLHPAILSRVKQKISSINFPYCIIIIPLLAEQIHHYKPLLHHIVVVDIGEAQQLARTKMRDSSHLDLVQKIIQAQVSRDQRLKIADTIIHNDGNLDELKNKIKDLHQIFLNQGCPLS